MLEYATRRPKELGTFRWTIDAKDRNLTEYEDLWRLLICGWLQSNSLVNPITFLTEGDYSAFARFDNPDLVEPPAHLKGAVSTRGHTFRSFDVKKVMLEAMEFCDSADSRGLQLVDICANAFRRGCNSKLKRRGWRNLGSLMVRDITTHTAVLSAVLSGSEHLNSVRTPAWAVIKEAENKAALPLSRSTL